MSNISTVNKILVSGGTHGNELSGVQAVKYWQNNNEELRKHCPSALVDLALINEKAIEKRMRYVDEDLNRQFTFERLAKNGGAEHNALNHEQQLAQSINTTYGPKHDPKYDLVIDIHNTTSNMGPSVILLSSDNFHIQIARFIKQSMPEAVILVEDQIDYQAHPYFCTIGKRGVMLELGPQAHGTLKAALFLQTKQLTEIILRFIQTWNTKALEPMPETTGFRLDKEVPYPTRNGLKSAMIHPSIDGEDFNALATGSPCFLGFDGNDIHWEEDTTYPHFIGEAAYHHLDIAFATAKKIDI
ncbi:aspartoacylase [Agaribacter marinus]|uniref:Aspartoacylase n=1 Tax=Agaribacter marinus TaxID=1431249 RepID=A0AA37SWP3_9ALTE|nr:aspartoacylase [Agaribacter marinus]GLR71053.1 putative aspartoacylase [Agaribacter marinus]